MHNHVVETLACLDCLGRQSYCSWTAIVVDDGSTDGTFERVRESHPDTVILSGDGNLWWSGATSIGIREARRRARNRDFVLMLNNDMIAYETRTNRNFWTVNVMDYDNSYAYGDYARMMTERYTCLGPFRDNEYHKYSDM